MRQVKQKTAERKMLIEELDECFSLYIRLKDSDLKGHVKCITCPEVKPFSQIDCGHFMLRHHIGTRWDEQNCGPQCQVCNRVNYGEGHKFEAHIDGTHGKGMGDILRMRARSITKLFDWELQEKIDHYKAEVSRLKKERNIK